MVLKVLDESEVPLSSTQISEKISSNTNGKLFKVSGVLKDTSEKRLRKLGYVKGEDILNMNSQKKQDDIYSITPKGKNHLKGWISFLKVYE